MKTLIRPKYTAKKYPKHKVMHCDSCKAWLYASLDDCEKGETVLHIPALYVHCPHCGESLHYHNI